MQAKRETIVIIGAGLVGALLAIYLARRGYKVAVYEKSDDMAKVPHPKVKSSINLTLSERGFRALDQVGVGDPVRKITVPVYGRLIHDLLGNLAFQRYGDSNQALYAVFRDDLNKVLLHCARQNRDIDFYFNEKCQGLDLATNTVSFKNLRSGQVTYTRADRIFGADGAFSNVRLQLQKLDRFSYSQQYMDYGYRELTLPPSNDQQWIYKQGAIHFWPRNDYMLMGFINFDGSFTLSLHMPFQGEVSFDSIRTEDDLQRLFEGSFPDVLPQMPGVIDDYFAHPTNSMVTIRCFPWTFQDKVALIGDAAHAMVPYYGQGANAGFEDCAVLDSCIEAYAGNWPQIFREYERLRKPNTDAISDLALRNFVELRDRVADPRFLVRKQIEQRVHLRHPDKYTGLYSMIAFGAMPYAEALRVDQAQRVIIDRIMELAGGDCHDGDDIDRIIDEVLGCYAGAPEHDGVAQVVAREPASRALGLRS